MSNNDNKSCASTSINWYKPTYGKPLTNKTIINRIYY